MPLSRLARSTTVPEGALVVLGSVHVEFAAQRAVIDVIRTPVPDASFSVQPRPLPRPSATVTGTPTEPFAVATAGAERTTSFPGTNVSFTMIVPAPAGAARSRARSEVEEDAPQHRTHSGLSRRPGPFPGCERVPTRIG